MTTRIHVGRLLCSTAFLSSLFLFSDHVLAQDNSVALDELTIIGTRTEVPVQDNPRSVSVVGQEQLKRQAPLSIGEALRDIPGVELVDAGVPGMKRLRIRGESSRRVTILVDGQEITDHSSYGTPILVNPAAVEKIDVVRGPASVLWGAKAIGGVVNFETIDPADMLRHGETWAASIKGQYSTNDEGKLISAIGAVKATDTVSMLANFVWRDHENYDDGGGREVENTEKELVSGLIKGVFDFGVGNQLKLSYIHKNDDYITGLASENNRQDTETEDRTFSAKWAYNPTGNDLIDLNVSGYYTNTRLEQTRLDNLFGRTGLQVSAGNERFFEIDTIGFDIFNSSRFATGQFNHTLTYGGDYFKDDVKTEDTGLGGSGDEFTPSGERETYGFYIQDKLEYGDWFEFIAALRYDSYELSDNGINVEEDQLSPKFTVGVTPFKGVQFYATYAEGFRAPSISETLRSGIHPVPPEFDILPNPNLRPETSENIEGGVNLAFDKVFSERDVFRAKAAIFRNDVEDFIENREVRAGVFGGPPGTPTCFFDATLFPPGPNQALCGANQFLNIGKARLEGFELEATYDNKLMFVNLAYTHVRGDDLTNGQPLKSIYPDKVVATVGFRFLEDKLTVGGRWIYADGQNRVPDPVNPRDPSIDETPTPSYSLVDLFATYEVNENFSTALTLNNIFDEDYRIHRHEENEPGFSAKLSATVRFGG